MPTLGGPNRMHFSSCRTVYCSSSFSPYSIRISLVISLVAFGTAATSTLGGSSHVLGGPTSKQVRQCSPLSCPSILDCSS